MTATNAELADRFEAAFLRYRPELFGENDCIAGPAITRTECMEIAAALRASPRSDEVLQRCGHGNCLRDGAGEALEPPCGCRVTFFKTNIARPAEAPAGVRADPKAPWRCLECSGNLSAPPARQTGREECHKLDTERQVFFYEQDFYILSNFSAFNVMWRGVRFQTAEHAYHFERFWGAVPQVTASIARDFICNTTSAHEAFRYAQDNKGWQRRDWDAVKVDAMRDILRAKVDQHEYVRRKLLATGDRELIDDSWRDDFWGWGLNRDGQNMLGKLWMEVRAELQSPTTSKEPDDGEDHQISPPAKTHVGRLADLTSLNRDVK